MGGEMTYERALSIAKEALEAYEKAETKAEVEEIFLKYGRDGIGHRFLCRMFFSKISPERAVDHYQS